MAATSKPLRKKTKEFISTARDAIKKGQPNKAVRKEIAKKEISAHGKISKGLKNSMKSMY